MIFFTYFGPVRTHLQWTREISDWFSPRFLLLVSLKSVYTAEQDPKTSQASSPPPFSPFKIHLQYLSLIVEYNSLLMQNFSALKTLYRSLNIVFPNLCSQTRSIFFSKCCLVWDPSCKYIAVVDVLSRKALSFPNCWGEQQTLRLHSKKNNQKKTT